MTSKSTLKNKFPKKFSNHVSNLFSWPKMSRKTTNISFLKLFINAMIKNIKIYNILDITKISKSMEPINVLIQIFYETIYLNVINDF